MALKIAGKSVVGRSDPAIHRWQGGKFPIEEWVRSPVRAAWSLRVGHGSGNRKKDNVIPVTLHW